MLKDSGMEVGKDRVQRIWRREGAYSTPFGHAFHQHPASHSTNIRPPVP
jgi:hypothetical protein